MFLIISSSAVVIHLTKRCKHCSFKFFKFPFQSVNDHILASLVSSNKNYYRPATIQIHHNFSFSGASANTPVHHASELFNQFINILFSLCHRTFVICVHSDTLKRSSEKGDFTFEWSNALSPSIPVLLYNDERFSDG